METSLKDAWALSSLVFIPTLLLWSYYLLKKPKEAPEIYTGGTAIGGVLSLAIWAVIAPDNFAFGLVYIVAGVYITGIALTPKPNAIKPTRVKPPKPITKKTSVREIKKLEKQAQKLWQKYPPKDEETFWDTYEEMIKKDA
jgi:hypothetical protein